MSETTTVEQAAPRTTTNGKRWWREHSELGVCALLAALGVFVLVDAALIETDFTQRGPIGPKTAPVVIGIALLVVSAILAVEVLRGGRGQSEHGEDIDLSASSDWRTVLLLTAAFLANAALVDVVGFPLSGMILFWGSAYALGSRNTVRDPLVAAVLSIVTFLAFNNLLGVPLPGGPLMGVL